MKNTPKMVKPHRLRWEIALTIAAKLVLISLIWYFCFSNPPSKHLTDQKFAQHILASH